MQPFQYAQENVTKQARETPNEEPGTPGTHRDSFCKRPAGARGPGFEACHRTAEPPELLARVAVTAPARRNPRAHFRRQRTAWNSRGFCRIGRLVRAPSLRGPGARSGYTRRGTCAHGYPVPGAAALVRWR